jgi:hypothetical protein
MKKLLLILAILTCFTQSYSQEYFYPLNLTTRNDILKLINANNKIIHSAFFPIRKSYIQNILKKNINDSNYYKIKFINSRKHKLIWSKILTDNLISVKTKNLNFYLNLLLDYHKTYLKNDTNKYWQNTRGFEIHGTLGKKLSFYTDFFENQAYFIPYIDSVVNATFVVPGQGEWKIFGNDKKGKDYNFASGYISYSPTNFLNIQFGHSKNFVGFGYRSLLLSDNSFNYPFLKFTLTKNKLQYTAIFSELQSFKTKYYFYHYKKHATFTYLNYVPQPNIEIGLFEGIIWHTSDDSSYVKKFPFWYFIQIPLIRELHYGLNNKNNALIGLNFRSKIYKYGDIYGQILIDNISKINFKNRYAYQAGIHIYDILSSKIKNISWLIQLEYNYARPYTYTHQIASCAYTQMNQSLASPLGSGFSEIIAISSIKIFDFRIFAKYNKIINSYDTKNSNYGSNILLPNTTANFKNTNNFVGQGNKTNISILSSTISYEINNKTHLNIFVQITKRNFKNEFGQKQIFFVSFGVKNTLKNFYTDF